MEIQPNQPTTEELYKAFFSTNCKYYYNAFLRYKEKQKLTFNIWAALFPVFWMIYRKLYKEAIITYLILISIRVLLYIGLYFYTDYPLQFPSSFLEITTILIQFIPAGYLANYLYVKKAINLISTNKEIKDIRRAGDVNTPGLLIFIILGSVISLISFYTD